MSALDLSASVVALTTKALTLHAKGAFARAVELSARAEAAAKALGARDCLVVAALQVLQADCWLLQSKSPLVAPADWPSMVDAALALLPAAKATLLRRKAAGTLLPGTCAPHEEAWDIARLTHDLKLLAKSNNDDELRSLKDSLSKGETSIFSVAEKLQAMSLARRWARIRRRTSDRAFSASASTQTRAASCLYCKMARKAPQSCCCCVLCTCRRTARSCFSSSGRRRRAAAARAPGYGARGDADSAAAAAR
jgi:hypothetical protein